MTGLVGVDSNIDRFAVDMSTAAEALPAEVVQADSAAAELVGRASLSTVPLASGALLRSGVFGGGQIVYTADHAVSVFGGTALMPARPWVIDAWDANEPGVLAAYETAVTEALAGVN
jgi:hypothetical protein